MAFSNCSRGQKLQQANDAKGDSARVFATVGDVVLPISMVDKKIETLNQSSQYPPDMLAMLPIEYRIKPVIDGVSQTIQTADVYEIAKRQGFKQDDDSVKQALHLASQADFESSHLEQAKKLGQLKPDATIKDLEELAKPQLQGKTIKEVFTGQSDDVTKGLKDSQKRMEIVLIAAQYYAVEKFTKDINPTDDEVKKGFETYELKRILLKSTGAATDAAAKSRADKAYADLKANKSFEAVMDGSSEDTPLDPKKKKSESVLNFTQDQIESIPDFKIVLKMQPGSYSEPQKVTEGYAIIKYAGKKVDIPKDYETKKAQYRQQNISTKLQKKFKEELDKVEKDIKPTFETKAYEAVYRFQKASMMPAGPAQDQEFRAIYELAKGVTSSDDKPEIAASMAVIAIQHLYDQPTADKVKLKGDRIAALESYLTYSDSWPYRKDVIDWYKEKGDKTKAYDQVVMALDKNTKFDDQAQRTFSDISAKFLEIKTAGLVTADQEKQFRSKQVQWGTDKKKYDDEQALLKKQKELDDQKAKADAKKAADEAKKNPSKSPTPPPKTGGK